VLPAAQEHVLKQNNGKNRLANAVADLPKAFALAVPHETAIEIMMCTSRLSSIGITIEAHS